jgi:hypothetical protein
MADELTTSPVSTAKTRFDWDVPDVLCALKLRAGLAGNAEAVESCLAFLFGNGYLGAWPLLAK